MKTSRMLTAAILLSLTMAGPAEAQFFAPDKCTATFEKNGWTIQAWRERWEASAIREITLPRGMKTLRGKSKMQVQFVADYEDSRDGPYLRNITVLVPHVKAGGRLIDWGVSRGDEKASSTRRPLVLKWAMAASLNILARIFPPYPGRPT